MGPACAFTSATHAARNSSCAALDGLDENETEDEDEDDDEDKVEQEEDEEEEDAAPT